MTQKIKKIKKKRKNSDHNHSKNYITIQEFNKILLQDEQKQI